MGPSEESDGPSDKRSTFLRTIAAGLGLQKSPHLGKVLQQTGPLKVKDNCAGGCAVGAWDMRFVGVGAGGCGRYAYTLDTVVLLLGSKLERR